MNRDQIIKDWTDENRPIGEMLGYPDCCINEFCELPPQLMSGETVMPQHYDRYLASCIKGVFTGFVPCSKHATQILSGELNIYSLIDHKKRAENKEYFIPDFPFAM